MYVPFGSIANAADLRRALQTAIQVEHAVIPPYLTALYSLSPGANDQIRTILAGIVVEEMSHMALAANVLIAIGGWPLFDDPDFIPAYPDALPFKLVDHPGGEPLGVDLAPFSKEHVRSTFMRIEQSAHPIDYPGPPPPTVLGDGNEYQTIGEFYEQISKALTAAGSCVITGDPNNQVTQLLNGVFPVKTLDDAIRALETIVQQGEGSSTGPTSGDAELAHYYKFSEISIGRALVPGGPKGYSYTGPAIPFDRTAVLPILTNPRTADYAKHPIAQRLSEAFNSQYSNLLRSLNEAFNGAPGTIGRAVGLMYDCKLAARQLMGSWVGDLRAAPTYEYRAG